ncbi:MAG: anthranilate phosphoribosyltransferase [Pseudomonadota bacterium]
MNRPASTPDADIALMRSIIQRIATGPELSKDISADEARAGMSLILDGKVDPVQAAIFLIALRMKRESDAEYCGVLDALRDASDTVTVPVDELLDIGDPYDGFIRSLPPSPFLPAVMAACGVPTVAHGVETMGPKYGVTHRQILRAAGISADLSAAQTAQRLADKNIGWGYLDQQVFSPKLHRLAGLRTLIVKRPVLTTVEVCIGPLRARGRTHLMTGFVHKAYPRIYAMLARHAGFDSALIVRGVEGGVIPTLRQTGKLFYFHDGGPEQMRELMPAEFGFDAPIRPVALPGVPDVANSTENGPDNGRDSAPAPDHAAMVQATVELGLATLDGKAGPMRDALISAAAVALVHIKRHDTLISAANAVREVLSNGQAAAHFRR